MDAQAEVRRRQAQLAEEDRRHVLVEVLARMDQQRLHARRGTQLVQERRGLDELRPCANDEGHSHDAGLSRRSRPYFTA